MKYLGFSTPGAGQAKTAQPYHKPPGAYLHVAGSSLSKGTSAVISAWEKHPEWPPLTIVANNPLVERPLPANIELRKNLSSKDMEKLWRRTSVAIIPSEVEGYGQVLGEAMLAGAVIITTDAPPMNELVTARRGYLVPWSEERPWRLGTRYKVTADALESCLLKVLEEPRDTVEAKAREAYLWALDNHQAFAQRLSMFIKSAAPQKTPLANRENADQHG
ncbi:glycosyltransferase [Marinobacter sp. 71-i]|uniref:Glycosyltransferase n=1 Tax=Marinobacter iranensis TaxID=2962607 RepID=A0ABT5Y9U8_9GAMM|nr:glycosyltransferase [Marinobacter iranensis]MDF0750457.1 glycosyltransferase [Marinobacter iranensis]